MKESLRDLLFEKEERPKRRRRFQEVTGEDVAPRPRHPRRFQGEEPRNDPPRDDGYGVQEDPYQLLEDDEPAAPAVQDGYEGAEELGPQEPTHATEETDKTFHRSAAVAATAT